MMAYERFKSGRDNFDKFIYQFQPETKTLIRKRERILRKLYRQNMSLSFNQTCLNEGLLPNYIYILSKEEIEGVQVSNMSAQYQ